MTLQAYCIACLYGHHESHDPVPNPGTEGLIGSRHECPCKGECVKNPYRDLPEIAHALGTPDLEGLENLNDALGRGEPPPDPA